MTSKVFYFFAIITILVLKTGADVPSPVAFFPLNGIYGTREIQDRAPEGIPGDVHIAPGPKGHEGGSFEFSGASNSYIEFPNSAGGVWDARYSVTFLFWVSYNGQDGLLILYTPGHTFGVYIGTFNNGGVTGHFSNRQYQQLQHMHSSNALTSGEWRFVGVSYDNSSGEQQLSIDGVVVEASNIGPGHELGTQGNVRMGAWERLDGWFFRGRIALVRVYNIALTEEQIQEIRV